jgi:hypothetical protein
MPSDQGEIIRCSAGNNTNDFDAVISSRTTTLGKIPKRLNLNGQLLPLNVESKYSKYIFAVIVAALESEWFQNLGKYSHLGILSALKIFIRWINNENLNDDNRYSILKKFESHRVNECFVKAQSTGLNHILNLLNAGVHSQDISNEMVGYIHILLTTTKLSLYEERQPNSLNRYFGSIHWMRESLGESDYLKLESPKRLILSFSVTIATILLFIQNQKKLAKELLSSDTFFKDEDTLSVRAQNQFYCGNLFFKLCRFDENNEPSDNLTKLMILDFVPTRNLLKLNHLWKLTEDDNHKIYNCRLNGKQIFSKPNLFDSESWTFPSHFEQFLFSWLCACQSIQPFAIPKLKSSNFIISKDQHGRPVFLQANYFKGRGGRIHESPMLESRQIEAQAMLSYLQQFSNENIKLFNKDVHKSINLSFGMNSISEQLAHLLQFEPLAEQISENLKHRQCSNLFAKAYLALYKEKEFSFSKWMNGQQLKKCTDWSRKKYISEIKKPLPTNLFGLSGIKNSAVYSRSDIYRDNDLINQNSHTPLTEKISYLTDANKDWVNQNGRITRMVLNDIEHYVYKPNINAALAKFQDLQLRTRVVDVLSTGISNDADIRINKLGQYLDNLINDDYELNKEPDDIIVVDTVETVVNMLHFITETERQLDSLANNALAFFEQTILPTAEWMQTLLEEKLSPKVVRQGKSSYSEIRNILPPLFQNELKGGVGA